MLDDVVTAMGVIGALLCFILFVAVIGRGIERSRQARAEHAREIELAAHKTYADCRRAPRVDVRA